MLPPSHPMYFRLTQHNLIFTALLERIEQALDATDDRGTELGNEWSVRVMSLAVQLHDAVLAPEADVASLELLIYLAMKQLIKDVSTFEKHQSARVVGAYVDYACGGGAGQPEA